MRVKVSKGDIEMGVRYNCEDCPIAIAVQRRVKGKVNIFIGYLEMGSEASPYLKIGKEFFMLPMEVLHFIRAFDTRGKDSVEPFDFQIDIPKKLQKPGWAVEDS
jgi:hypothetical protein